MNLNVVSERPGSAVRIRSEFGCERLNYTAGRVDGKASCRAPDAGAAWGVDGDEGRGGDLQTGFCWAVSVLTPGAVGA